MQSLYSSTELQALWHRCHHKTLSELLLHFQSFLIGNPLAPSKALFTCQLCCRLTLVPTIWWMNIYIITCVMCCHGYCVPTSLRDFAESTPKLEPFYFILSESWSWEVLINGVLFSSSVLNHNSTFQPAASLSSAVAATHRQTFTSDCLLTLIWLIFYHSELVRLSVWLHRGKSLPRPAYTHTQTHLLYAWLEIKENEGFFLTSSN